MSARVDWEHPELGEAPVEEEYRQKLIAVVSSLDDIFNGDARGADRKVGFILMIFPFNSSDGRCNYMSNGARRDDVVALMKEQIRRFEAQPEIKRTP